MRAAVEAWRSDESRGGVLRDNARRRLVRIPGGEVGPLLVKHHRSAERHPWRERLKAWIGRSPAVREARHLEVLERAGVPVPGLAGLAELPEGGHLLVLPFLAGQAGAEGLPRERRARRAALAALGQAVRALHESGHVHGDLHGENVLFEGERAVLLDLQHVRPSRSPGDRLRDLGELDYSLWGRASLADRLRLRRAALGGSPSAESLRAVGRAARDKAHRHGRSRTRRLLRPGRQACALLIAEGRGLRLREIPAPDVAEALRAHRGLLARGGVSVLKNDARSALTRVEVAGRRLVVKELPTRSLLRAAADLWRGSGARRGWRAGHGLRVRGLGAALPLAFVESRRAGLPVRSWLVVEDLSPAVDLLTLPTERRNEVLEGIGAWLSLLHRRGVDHGDLKATHLFAQPTGDPRAVQLVDVEAVRFRPHLSDGARQRALAQLNASLPDDWTAERRWRAFRRYVTSEPFAAPAELAARQIAVASLARSHRWTGSDCPAARDLPPSGAKP